MPPIKGGELTGFDARTGNAGDGEVIVPLPTDANRLSLFAILVNCFFAKNGGGDGILSILNR